MTLPEITKKDAEAFREMRSLLAVIHREALNRGHVDLADLVKRVDDLAGDMLRQHTE